MSASSVAFFLRSVRVDRQVKWSGSIGFVLLTVAFFPMHRGQSQEASEDERYLARRTRLVEVVLRSGGIKSEAVLHAIQATPRHEFVPENLRSEAYFDKALPIGEKQTISSPYIVALMTESLQPQSTDKVLEIGTGSGYQAAVLSPLVHQVYTIEIVEELEAATTKLLKRLGYQNILTKAGDGYLGWPEYAPFDKIIVTCSPDAPPQPLIDQLKEGGLMVIPVGTRYQQMLRLFRKENGKLQPVFARPTFFVPMTGQAESQRRETIDGAHPRILNGDFELPANEGYIPKWYYEFGARWEVDPTAPSKNHVITFANDKRGSPSGLLQGFPIDGRVVRKLRLSGAVTTRGVRLGATFEEQPFIILQFIDGDRNQLGYNWIGPFVGDIASGRVESEIAVPADCREAIVMIGLFGSVGKASFDDIAIEVRERAPK